MKKIKKSYQKEIPKIVNALKAYQPEKIILFGSMLDLTKPSHDIDLLLIKETDLSRLGERAREARAYLPNQQIPVDFLIYSTEELRRELARGNVFIAEILQKGRLLYEEKV
ncbi:nucleotidyltransferase domain-containing protein [Candidatus Shapirobacteria bacterium]|nr:nucleotidyltransferase domain-containing protein [Candidatus Shapirobacteria bacterium]